MVQIVHAASTLRSSFLSSAKQRVETTESGIAQATKDVITLHRLLGRSPPSPPASGPLLPTLQKLELQAKVSADTRASTFPPGALTDSCVMTAATASRAGGAEGPEGAAGEGGRQARGSHRFVSIPHTASVCSVPNNPISSRSSLAAAV